MLAISATLLLLWSTEKILHPFDTSTTTVAAIAFMFLPRCRRDGLEAGAAARFPGGRSAVRRRHLPWHALLQTKAAGWLAPMASSRSLGLADSIGLYHPRAALLFFLIVVHLGFASATALAPRHDPDHDCGASVGVARLGLNLIGMTMILQFVVSFGFILPVNAPQNMVAYGTETFAGRGLRAHRARPHRARLRAGAAARRELLAVDGLPDEIGRRKEAPCSVSRTARGCAG